MKLFLRFGVGYFLLAVVIVLLTREDPTKAGWAMAEAAWNTSMMIGAAGGALALVGLRYHALAGTQTPRETLLAVLFAALGVSFFQAGFTLIKASMPHLMPFYADPPLAEIDRVLHGGSDPWVVVHQWANALPMQQIFPLYINLWVLPSLFLPVIIAAFDGDPMRIRRTMLLYVFAWVAIGNVLALAFLSVGPIYYDRLIGGERFADLIAQLRNSPFAGSELAQIQEGLWQVYSKNTEAVGAGISAFPSVHLSVATVVALYLRERGRVLAIVGGMFVVLILFLSVYTGFHYAIDGYFSILVMGTLWVWLWRRGSTRTREAAPDQAG